MLLQKLYRPLVELVHLLINGSVSAAFEDDKFRPPNLRLHELGKAQARDHVVAATRNLGRGRNLAEMRLDIVRKHRVRLSHKSVHGLRGAPPDKSRQRLDVVWLGDIEFGGETPRENALYYRLGYASRTSDHDLPAFYHRFDKEVGFGPAVVER
jgi:hypothetical protein